MKHCAGFRDLIDELTIGPGKRPGDEEARELIDHMSDCAGCGRHAAQGLVLARWTAAAPADPTVEETTLRAIEAKIDSPANPWRRWVGVAAMVSCLLLGWIAGRVGAGDTSEPDPTPIATKVVKVSAPEFARTPRPRDRRAAFERHTYTEGFLAGKKTTIRSIR